MSLPLSVWHTHHFCPVGVRTPAAIAWWTPAEFLSQTLCFPPTSGPGWEFRYLIARPLFPRQWRLCPPWNRWRAGSPEKGGNGPNNLEKNMLPANLEIIDWKHPQINLQNFRAFLDSSKRISPVLSQRFRIKSLFTWGPVPRSINSCLNSD